MLRKRGLAFLAACLAAAISLDAGCAADAQKPSKGTTSATVTPLAVELDDGSLGISLHERIRQIKDSGSVAIWLDGHWGPLVRVGMPITQANKHTVAVRKVGEQIKAADINAQVVQQAPPCPRFRQSQVTFTVLGSLARRLL